jgi:ATP-dependent DNA helicase RecQ
VSDIARQFTDGAAALSMMHVSGQLEWVTPHRYKLVNAMAHSSLIDQGKALQYMDWYLRTNGCRWRFLLETLGFEIEGKALGGSKGCGHCDRCVP